MAINLTCDVKKFIGIIHTADIHIRLTKRHDEYSEIFSKLYSDIDVLPKEFCILVAGDLFHSKSDLSPECIDLASSFLKNLANRRPTVIIPGNHDATLANKNRLDSISPIVSALNHPNLFYLKDSGLYILGNILFNHMSVFDEPSKYILEKDIPKIYKNQTDCKIALFHGPVNLAKTDIGFEVSNPVIQTNLFDGHDLALLGDIHRFQQLPSTNSNVKIVYPGSMIQQDHGEGIKKHGYVLWNLNTKNYNHVSIDNDYGFFTIDINKGKLTTDVSVLPKKTRLRCRCFESVTSEVKSIVSDLRNKTDIIECVYGRVDELSNMTFNKTVSIKDLNLIDLAQVDYQNLLIKEFLQKNKNDEINDKVLSEIFELNKEYNQTIDKDKFVKNFIWKPKKFEFSNMFSYGEGNVIDFSKLKDVVGLFAPNASGKSAILDSLCFCIFDKAPRCFKGSHVLNAQKIDRKSTRLNSSHVSESRMPSSA